MNKKQFYKIIGKVGAGIALPQSEVEQLAQFAEELIDKIEDWEEDDNFGTEGWEHRVGWD